MIGHKITTVIDSTIIIIIYSLFNIDLESHGNTENNGNKCDRIWKKGPLCDKNRFCSNIFQE